MAVCFYGVAVFRVVLCCGVVCCMACDVTWYVGPSGDIGVSYYVVSCVVSCRIVLYCDELFALYCRVVWC